MRPRRSTGARVTRALRRFLLTVGLILLLASLAALAYAWWPTGSTSEQFRLDPGLFLPPQSGLDGARYG